MTALRLLFATLLVPEEDVAPAARTTRRDAIVDGPLRALPGRFGGVVLPRRHALHFRDRRVGNAPRRAPSGAGRTPAPRPGGRAAAGRADPPRRAHTHRARDARRPRPPDLAAEPA